MPTFVGAPTYAPAGSCIYCGASRYSIDRVKLGEEHVVPFCLDGAHVLPEASCKKCEKITGGLEGALFGAHGPYLSGRIHAGAQSRGKSRKKGEETIPLYVGEPPNQVRLDLPAAWAPRWMVNMEFPLPAGILTGQGRFDRQGDGLDFWVVELNPGATAKLGAPTSPPGMIPGKVMQFLAKIGHAYATAELGIDGFRPFLTDFILGRDDRIPWGLVGGGPEDAATPQPYTIGLRIVEVGSTRYVVGEVRLLRRASFPSYQIVVGTME